MTPLWQAATKRCLWHRSMRILQTVRTVTDIHTYCCPDVEWPKRGNGLLLNGYLMILLGLDLKRAASNCDPERDSLTGHR